MLYVTLLSTTFPSFLMSGALLSDCGNSVSNGGQPASDGNVGCNMACSGKASETYDGPNKLDLYTFGATSTCTAISTVTVTTTITSTGSSTTTTIDPCTTPNPAVSIVHNGGFERGIVPWQQQLVSVATAGLTLPSHSSQFAY